MGTLIFTAKTAARLAMSFQIGQQVICISNRFSANPYWRRAVCTFPQLNSIYSIREIHEGWGSQIGLIGFCFDGIINPTAYFSRGQEEVLLEPAFNSKHFRPVKPTNIDVFKSLLIPRELEKITPSHLCDLEILL